MKAQQIAGYLMYFCYCIVIASDFEKAGFSALRAKFSVAKSGICFSAHPLLFSLLQHHGPYYFIWDTWQRGDMPSDPSSSLLLMLECKGHF